MPSNLLFVGALKAVVSCIHGTPTTELISKYAFVLGAVPLLVKVKYNYSWTAFRN